MNFSPPSTILIGISLLVLSGTAACAQTNVPNVVVQNTRSAQPTQQVTLFPTDTPATQVASQEPSTETQANPTIPQKKDGQEGISYIAQSGDTLIGVAVHFGVSPDEITSPDPIPPKAFIQPGQTLNIPNKIKGDTTPSQKLLPDSEVVFSSTAIDFSCAEYTITAGGFLNRYGELRGTGWYSGADIINQTALEYSINPRLLLALLEYHSHWVYGKPATNDQAIYPLGLVEGKREQLFSQIGLTAQELNIGYYGWRSGTLTELAFPDGSRMRLAPDLNAGTVALQYLFSKIFNPTDWQNSLYGPENLMDLYARMFNESPWERAQAVEPLIPGNLTQPVMELPFRPGGNWNYTGGPHAGWGTIGPRSAIDFAPGGVKGCALSDEKITAVATGLVVRVGEGPVIVDLDNDGYEQTGWNILYMHVSAQDRVTPGVFVNTNDTIGHPSCYGGHSTGTHVHIARKYNGEWMTADGPAPFVMGGWEVRNDKEDYVGTLVKDNLIVESSRVAAGPSNIVR